MVLHQTKYSDSTLIIHAVDSIVGRKSFMLRGVGSAKGKRSAALFHPLNIIDVVSASSPKSSLAYIREWEAVASLSSIRQDIFKSSVAIFISEVLYRSLRTEDSEEGLFDWLCSAVSMLETTQGSVANFHLWFMASYCTRMGFEPAGSFEPQAIFSQEELDLLEKIMKMPLEQTLSIPLSAARRQAFSRKMIQYLSFHLGLDLNVRSLDVLHSIFA